MRRLLYAAVLAANRSEYAVHYLQVSEPIPLPQPEPDLGASAPASQSPPDTEPAPAVGDTASKPDTSNPDKRAKWPM